jgi:hypothetical protein
MGNMVRQGKYLENIFVYYWPQTTFLYKLEETEVPGENY